MVTQTKLFVIVPYLTNLKSLRPCRLSCLHHFYEDTFKGIVHPEIKTQSSSTHRQSQLKFLNPRDICGASQRNGVAELSYRTLQ